MCIGPEVYLDGITTVHVLLGIDFWRDVTTISKIKGKKEGVKKSRKENLTG